MRVIAIPLASAGFEAEISAIAVDLLEFVRAMESVR